MMKAATHHRIQTEWVGGETGGGDKGVTGSYFFRDLAFYRGNPRERIYSRPCSSFWILTGAILVNSGKQELQGK
jgi:hypothetical protein